MDVVFLGVTETMRVAIASLLRDGAIGRIGIVSTSSPANILYYLTTGWTGERSRVDGRVDGSDLVVRGRYARGGLREDVIAVRSPASDDLKEFVGSYDLCVDTGAGAMTGEEVLGELRVTGDGATCRAVSWTLPSETSSAVWPWDAHELARDRTRAQLPPSTLVTGVAALRVAAAMGQLGSASVLCVGPSSVPVGDAWLLAGSDVLNLSWDPERDFAELSPDAVTLEIPVRYARVRAPVTRGASVVVAWEWRERIEEPNFARALRHAVRGELEGVLIMVDHACESSAAFQVQSMGVLPRSSAMVTPLGGVCGIAITEVDAASIQLVKLIAHIEEHDMATSTRMNSPSSESLTG